MSSKLLLTAKMDQRLLMNQQLKQVINLLQYTTLELKQQIQEFIDTNPLIELKEEISDDDESTWGLGSYQTTQRSNHYEYSDEDYLSNIPAELTFRDYLLKQSLDCHFTHRQHLVAEAIIDAIDDNGYLTMTIDDIQSMLNEHYDIEELEHVLAHIQTFSPIGVGARTAKECLLIQIEQLYPKSLEWHNVKKILLVMDLSAHQLDIKYIAKQAHLKEAEVVAALQLMKRLELHPGKQYTGIREQIIEPELYVKKIKNIWRVFLSDTLFTKLNINKEYQAIIKSHSRDKAYKSLSGQLQEARLLLNGLKRRNETLLAVAEYIVTKQADFFERGSEGMHSMTLAEAAADLGYHESTISRITTGKYIATPDGMYELKYFFPSHVTTTAGRYQSSTSVKSMIETIIANEEGQRAYSDDQIMLILKQQGIKISRRTVTKYRESMNIPSSYQRTDINMLKVKGTVRVVLENELDNMEVMI